MINGFASQPDPFLTEQDTARRRQSYSQRRDQEQRTEDHQPAGRTDDIKEPLGGHCTPSGRGKALERLGICHDSSYRISRSAPQIRSAWAWVSVEYSGSVSSRSYKP